MSDDDPADTADIPILRTRKYATRWGNWKERDRPVTLPAISTTIPQKWRYLDLETGAVFRVVMQEGQAMLVPANDIDFTRRTEKTPPLDEDEQIDWAHYWDEEEDR